MIGNHSHLQIAEACHYICLCWRVSGQPCYADHSVMSWKGDRTGSNAFRSLGETVVRRPSGEAPLTRSWMLIALSRSGYIC